MESRLPVGYTPCGSEIFVTQSGVSNAVRVDVTDFGEVDAAAYSTDSHLSVSGIFRAC